MYISLQTNGSISTVSSKDILDLLFYGPEDNGWGVGLEGGKGRGGYGGPRNRRASRHGSLKGDGKRGSGHPSSHWPANVVKATS